MVIYLCNRIRKTLLCVYQNYQIDYSVHNVESLNYSLKQKEKH